MGAKAPGFDNFHPGPSAETGSSLLELGAAICPPAIKSNVTFSVRLWYHRTVNFNPSQLVNHEMHPCYRALKATAEVYLRHPGNLQCQ